ncbi:MAG: ATP-binding protein [Christensenellaceae bacterium]
MKRKIIKINEALCTGCGICVTACHEGAIGVINGKAKLLREDYCDGLGDCLPGCPTGAIAFEEREAPAYNESAVKMAKLLKAGGGCPSMRAKILRTQTIETNSTQTTVSELKQWPVQIKLVPVNAPYFNGADLLIAADCAAYAYASFHQDFIRGKITLIGCPKLDGVDYSEKLSEIFALNDVNRVTVVRMEVPCCGGLTNAVHRALEASGKPISLESVIITTDGNRR